MEEATRNGESFLGERSASPSEGEEDEPSEHAEGENGENTAVTVHDEDVMDVVDALVPIQEDETSLPMSIMRKSRMNALSNTPRKRSLFEGNDWADQLQRTISPRKQDRKALRESQAMLFRDSEIPRFEMPEIQPAPKNMGEITTSIDLMNSLFGQEEARRSVSGKSKGKKGFEV